MPTSIVWFRNDLRLADNPALTAGARRGPIVPVYILDQETEGLRARGGASRWWLHQSLTALDLSLRRYGSRLVLRQGKAEQVLPALASEYSASAIYWNRAYDQGSVEQERRLQQLLTHRGVSTESFKGNFLFEPWEVKTSADAPFKVFTPFWRACRALPPPPLALPAPQQLSSPANDLADDTLASWQLLPNAPDWAGGLRETWTPGEAGATERLSTFLDGALARYRQERDAPAGATTSRLSPHLAFGEISPRQIWHAALAAGDGAAVEKFLSELGWREFSCNLLFHSGDLAQRNFRPEFDAFPWREDSGALKAWQQGRTGFPIIDAGMRELWATGWMHNRVRMIVASFLTKDLLIDWRAGERWFWDTLVDADPANNPVNWQWVAGCGADAAPYFRIFNPVLQAKKIDPRGDYVRRWIPELAALPEDTVHQPWKAGPSVAVAYPTPIVDHASARARALDAFHGLKKARPDRSDPA
ncbi:MAG: deoxyribodipyrimidine photo-lyase [Alphaproteobacteria bacterium]|nr:deoxyribodipyrimidine photo-lyase [Alphaproteobacteria bacterium]